MTAATGSDVRARFAPSPTGHLHIGSAWTALFNWLLARHAGGQLLLRIEDTDTERSTQESVDLIFRTLEWLHLDWDGEPVYQSRNAERHVEAAQELIASGHAYYCDCTREAIAERADQRGGASGYDAFCRDRDVEPGPNAVVRFRTPDDGDTSFHDAIRGEVSFPNSSLEDFVIVRSSGMPMFLVANVVDDIDMGITHVLRGQDLLNTVPKQILLREALGHPKDEVVYGHLPLIVDDKGKKYSKRFGPVAVEEYRDNGYLAEAFINYLSTLGWGAPDGVEVRPLREIVDLFDYNTVSKSPAMFDFKKLDNFNGDYIRALPAEEFIEGSQPFLRGQLPPGVRLPYDPADVDEHAFAVMAPLVQERVKTLADVPGTIDFLFLADDAILRAPRSPDEEPEPGERYGILDEKSWDKVMIKGNELAVEMLDMAIDRFGSLEPWETAAINDTIIGYADEHEIPRGKAQAPIRVAVTGRSVGPPLWEAIELLGREQTLARLRAARQRVSG